MTALSVSKNQLLRDGQPFIPTGFNSVAAYHAESTWGFKTAFNQFKNSCASIKRLGGNTLLLKVLQLPLSSGTTTLDAYVAQIAGMVQTAQAAGLVVTICMQDQVKTPNPAHYSDMTVKITDATFAAWKKLAPRFRDDLSTSFELFNEPDYSSGDWASWHSAMQPLVDQIRQTNENVIWVPGGSEWTVTAGVSYHHKQMTLHGLGTHSILKGDNLGYSVHPYNYAHVKPTEDAAWHDRYYYLTAVAPVLFSEGYFDQLVNKPFDSLDKVQQVQQAAAIVTIRDFLTMCKTRKIGYLGYVIDSSQELVSYDTAAPVWNPQPTPTGLLLTDWFRSV